MKKFTIILTALLLASPLQAVAGPQTDRKTRRQLEKENSQLRQRLESIQQELDWLRQDKNERDSLERQMELLYREDRKESAADYFDSPGDFQESGQQDGYQQGDFQQDGDFDYTDSVTDSLLSVWYLHRQIRENPQANYNMDSVHFTSGVPDQVLIERLERMNSFIRLPYNETVKNYMVLYSEKMPTRMSQMLGLAQYYMPIFEEAFRKYGLPLELKYMAIIESALNPVAVSRVGATGMWQFMHSTARNYGLRIDSYIDDRMDPVASVDAAARYLRDAYRIFGDWSLAISSYNCGSGNVNKAIKRAGRRDFWSIYPYLPRETRGYVPAMVGAMYAINYAKEYGLEPAPVQMPEHVDTFMVNKNLHFRQVSEVIGIPIDDLRDLNPQYYKDIVPGAQGDQVLRLPFNYSNAFIDSQDTIYKHKAAEMFSGSVEVGRPQPATSTRKASSGSGSWVYYKVRRGDNLGKIAARHHTTVKNIKSWNGLKSDKIREGQRLKVGKR
ncbi:MAG: transglycosylase SLT domain-containing protein [Bacteroidales bacterium]|nr:transglycosylase SLT domain-containing protein [Bacteroidales bacterium]